MSQGDGSAGAAGARLQAARTERGLDLGVLAAQLKVPAARLEALEAGRWQDLPDGPYARGLAKAVCRVLQIDAEPVLQAMPGSTPDALERVTVGLNQPFREGGAPAPWFRWLWLALALLAGLLAAALWFWPSDGWQPFNDPTPAAAAPVAPTETAGSPPPVASSATAASGSAEMPSTAASSAIPIPAAAPSSPASIGAAAPASAPVASGLLRISAQQATWVSVSDARGQSLASRLLQPGEVLSLDPSAAPIRVTLGNAPGARLEWRGQVQDLSAYAQLRVARLELP